MTAPGGPPRSIDQLPRRHGVADLDGPSQARSRERRLGLADQSDPLRAGRSLSFQAMVDTRSGQPWEVSTMRRNHSSPCVEIRSYLAAWPNPGMLPGSTTSTLIGAALSRPYRDIPPAGVSGRGISDRRTTNVLRRASRRAARRRSVQRCPMRRHVSDARSRAWLGVIIWGVLAEARSNLWTG